MDHNQTFYFSLTNREYCHVSEEATTEIRRPWEVITKNMKLNFPISSKFFFANLEVLAANHEKFSEKLIILNPWYARSFYSPMKYQKTKGFLMFSGGIERDRAYQKTRNIGFSENFTHVLNEWSLNGSIFND